MKNGAKWFKVLVPALLMSAMSACMLSSESLPSPLPTVLPTREPTPTMISIEALDPTGCEVHLWHSFTDKKEEVLLNLASKFQTDNPYAIRLRIEFHSPLHSEVLAAISAGTPPDIVIVYCDQVAEYALANAIVPLTEYVSNATYGLSQAEQDDLWPAALESGCLSALTKQPLGLFFDSYAVVMFYNKSWLKKLKADAPPQTWDEFRKLCNAARDKKSATYGYVYVADGPTLVNWISGLGSALIDPRSGEALLDSPQAIAALSILRDLHQDGCAYFVSEPGADRADFAAEKVLFTFASTGDLSEYTQAILNPKTKKAKFTWSIAPIPHLTDEPLVNVQGSIMSILRTAPRQQLAAWLFLKWFLQAENDAQWALSTGALPLHKSNQETTAMKDYFEQNPQYEIACSLMAYAQLEPAVPKWRDIRELLAKTATIVCLGQAEPQEALAAADVAADSLLVR